MNFLYFNKKSFAGVSFRVSRWCLYRYGFCQVWFPGTKEGELQKMILENDGYRLTSLCGYSVRVSGFRSGLPDQIFKKLA